MDFLFVKTKGRQGTFRKVLSNQTVYNDIPEFEDKRPYNDELNLRDGQWFVLEHFSEKDYAPILIREEFNSAAWSQIGREDYDKIDYIVSVQNDGNLLIFQNVTTRLIYKRQSLLSLDEQPSLIQKGHTLVINMSADAYYVRDTDSLYFKRLSNITSIFSGINELYNEATDAEVDSLFRLSMLHVDPDFTRDKVKTANRRKIKEALDMYNNYTPAQKTQIPDYIRRYCVDLVCDEHERKFEISNERTLSLLLNGLCQRYYTTEISNEKKVALATEGVV